MLRIHVDETALTRVTVGSDPLWETVLAGHQLVARGPKTFTAWRQRAGRLASRTDTLSSAVQLLHALAPPRTGYFPDFLTPQDGQRGLQAGLEALCATPRARLRPELVKAFDGRRAPVWVQELAEGRSGRVRQVAQAVRTVHRTLVAPDWAGTDKLVEADRAVRSRALRDGGVHGLLSSLRPHLRWQPPVLEMDYPESRDLHLNGRGLCLIPSRFCWGKPVALEDPSLPQVVVYPVDHSPLFATADPRALGALVGRTRARVLAAVETASTCSDLSRRLGIAPSSVSEHVSVLRAAGLVVSVRHDNRVLHTLTPLGRGLGRGESLQSTAER
ncbi:ArsR/SmtB family transcription factor [Streptomyces reniochalinae]|uniref:ArsR family transcriptional regulator n=1 Tax=Streptomyces reniochalinae TaxID=2250578 RepID=A0A367EIT5_9ACTN|nr:winged helix-turn-helix domain-containing protein [Streptomyces reniochalinae]RCG17612.1 ArsR family transcriptional regulator [Streptomyces reniochalinae]